MSEANQNQEVDTTDLDVSPEQLLLSLKSKADLMGVKYHPSISYSTLLAKVREAQASDKPAEQEPEATAPVEQETIQELRARYRAEATKLVRVNISNMNPFKRDIESEIVSAGNSYVGTIKRCIPFNTTDGWHVEQILLNTLRERKCQVFRTVKGQGGQPDRRESQLVNEFAIEVLDPLTPQELKELARRQAMQRAED